MKESLIDLMARKRIFELVDVEGGIELAEACDHYFATTLTPNQLVELGLELIQYALQRM